MKKIETWKGGGGVREYASWTDAKRAVAMLKKHGGSFFLYRGKTLTFETKTGTRKIVFGREQRRRSNA